MYEVLILPKFSHMVFWCNDLEMIRKFYEEILGFEVHNAAPNGQWISYKNRPFRFAFMEGAPEDLIYRGWARPPFNPEGDNWEPFFTVEVEDLKTIWKKLKAAGFRTRSEDVYEDEKGITGQVLDPAGNTLPIPIKKHPNLN